MAEQSRHTGSNSGCGEWSEAATQKLLRMLRDNQGYCTETGCYTFQDCTCDNQPASEGYKVMWALVVFLMAFMMVMVLFRDRGGERKKPAKPATGKKGQGGGQDPPADPPSPTLF